MDFRTRLIFLVGPGKAVEVFALLDEEAASRCRDADCIRWWPHSRLARHLWRHECGAPRTRGLFGWRCFNCGQSSWRRIHRTGGGS